MSHPTRGSRYGLLSNGKEKQCDRHLVGALTMNKEIKERLTEKEQ